MEEGGKSHAAGVGDMGKSTDADAERLGARGEVAGGPSAAPSSSSEVGSDVLRNDMVVDGKMTWIIDFVGFSLFNQPPWKTSKETLDILQNHYPERLANALLYDPPYIFRAFWTAIKPFIDPKTKKKVVSMPAYCSPEVWPKYVARSQREAQLGGTLADNFDAEESARSMMALEKAGAGAAAWPRGHALPEDAFI